MLRGAERNDDLAKGLIDSVLASNKADNKLESFAQDR